MGVTVYIYENSFTTGKGIGFDNGPGSNDDDEDLDWLIVSDTRDYSYGEGVVTQEYTKNGIKYSAAVELTYVKSFSAPVPIGRYWTGYSQSAGGSIDQIWTGFYEREDLAIIYTGDSFLSMFYFGPDKIFGSSVSDKIYGYYGPDRLEGRAGNDIINGGGGTDYIFGGDGDDTLIDSLPRLSVYSSDGYYYGGNGIDTLEIDARSTDIMLSKNPETGTVIIYSKEGFNSLAYTDIEYIQLKDKLVTTSEIEYLGRASFEFNSTKSNPVYEFYNAGSDAYFYTSDVNERNTIIANSNEGYSKNIFIQKSRTSDYNYYNANEKIFVEYSTGEMPYFYQGSSYNAASTNSTLTRAIHRFYNTDTGHHLWSIDPAEIELIKSKWDSGEWSYKYEGTSYLVYSADPDKSDASIGEEVYRLYNSASGRHFYTADSEEVTEFQLTGQWTLEGVAFWGE